MRDVPSWEKYFMDVAYKVAERSKDPSTQVGAVLVNPENYIVGTGYNGFVQGVKETAKLWERPRKYDLVIHAETNAIAHAARRGISTNNCTMYVTAIPCLSCMKIVLASGVREIRADKAIPGWEDEHAKSVDLCIRAGVHLWIRGMHQYVGLEDEDA